MKTYGPTLKTFPSNLGFLTDDVLRRALHNMRASAPGLDHIAATELQIAVSWSPDLLSHLTSLLRLVETIHAWPDNLTKGVVVFPEAHFYLKTLLFPRINLKTPYQHDSPLDLKQWEQAKSPK